MQVRCQPSATNVVCPFFGSLPFQCTHGRPALSCRSWRRGNPERLRAWHPHSRAFPNTTLNKRRTGHHSSCTAEQNAEAGTTSSKAGSLIGFALWAAFLGYALFLSPNQTPYRDQYYILKQVGLGPDDGFQVNTVWIQLFNSMGIWPAIYASLLIPSGRSGNKVPAWPFVALSFAFGILALGPYFALWTPTPPQGGPPKQSDLTGWGRWGQQWLESPFNGALILAGTCAVLFQAATAGPEQWSAFLKMFDESRFEHVTILDFSSLLLLAPYWVLNDAGQRQWESRGPPVPVWPLAFIPFLGPALYLLLRPRATSD